MSPPTQPTHHDVKSAVEPCYERSSQSAWKRATLVAALAVFCWLAFYLGPGANPESKIVYASRYSKEFKYRPAASPIITERLKDGRVRLRGAMPS